MVPPGRSDRNEDPHRPPALAARDRQLRAALDELAIAFAVLESPVPVGRKLLFLGRGDPVYGTEVLDRAQQQRFLRLAWRNRDFETVFSRLEYLRPRLLERAAAIGLSEEDATWARIAEHQFADYGSPTDTLRGEQHSLPDPEVAEPQPGKSTNKGKRGHPSYWNDQLWVRMMHEIWAHYVSQDKRPTYKQLHGWASKNFIHDRAAFDRLTEDAPEFGRWMRAYKNGPPIEAGVAVAERTQAQ